MNCAAGDKMLSVIFPEISLELFFRVWINIFFVFACIALACCRANNKHVVVCTSARRVSI